MVGTLESILRVEQPEPSRAAWDRWDRRMKKRLGFWSALSFGGKDSLGNPMLVQWHWRHREYASWRLYPLSTGTGWLRHLGVYRSSGCISVALWITGFIFARQAPGARDVPSLYNELHAPAIHDTSGEYAGGGKDGATAREWPDYPPFAKPRPPQSYDDFLRAFFGR